MKMNAETGARALVMGFAILMALLLIPINRGVATDGGLNLPSTLVRIEVSNGTESYFNTNLSEVPSGYDVGNATYPGWCVDKTAEMTRSPAIHEVTLYSSMNAPGNLTSERWDLVNYILNHKNGTAWDVQQAIWYFVNMIGNYSPSTTMAWAIVNDTLANGNGFIPGEGQAIAVICLPKVLLPEPSSVQISIIEAANTTIPEFPPSAIPVLFTLVTLSTAIVCKRTRLRMRQ